MPALISRCLEFMGWKKRAGGEFDSSTFKLATGKRFLAAGVNDIDCIVVCRISGRLR